MHKAVLLLKATACVSAGISLWLIASSHTPAAAQQNPPAQAPALADEANCMLDACRRYYEANELGIGLETITFLRRLQVEIPPDLSSDSLQPFLDDLHMDMHLDKLLNVATPNMSLAFDQVDRRLLVIGAREDHLFYLIGAEIAKTLFKNTALRLGQGAKANEPDETAYLKSWKFTALNINDQLQQAGLPNVKLDRGLDTLEQIQDRLCQLKSSLDRGWQKDFFSCGVTVAQIQSYIQKSAETPIHFLSPSIKSDGTAERADGINHPLVRPLRPVEGKWDVEMKCPEGSRVEEPDVTFGLGRFARSFADGSNTGTTELAMGYTSDDDVKVSGYVLFDQSQVYVIEASAHRTGPKTFAGTGKFGSASGCDLKVTAF